MRILIVLDNILLSCTKKTVWLWSRATGKSNFALARLCIVLAFLGPFALGVIEPDGLILSFVAAPMFVAFFWLLIISPLEREANRIEQSDSPAISAYGILAVYLATTFGIISFFEVLGVLALTMRAIFLEDMWPVAIFGFWTQSALCTCLSVYSARVFDPGGKSKVWEFATNLAKRIRALVPEPSPALEPAPVPVPTDY